MEDLNPERASCNRADDIDRILLLPDILSPSAEDVPLLVDVGIILSPAEVCLKADLETSEQAVTLRNFFLQTCF